MSPPKQTTASSHQPTLSQLRRDVAEAEKRTRAAKEASKIAKKLSKDTKRDLKRARKALLAAEESAQAEAKPSTKQSGAKKKTAKKTTKRKVAAKQPSAATRQREIGSRIASSPEVRRAIRVRKPRKALPQAKPHVEPIDAPEPNSGEVAAIETSEEN